MRRLWLRLQSWWWRLWLRLQSWWWRPWLRLRSWWWRRTGRCRHCGRARTLVDFRAARGDFYGRCRACQKTWEFGMMYGASQQRMAEQLLDDAIKTQWRR